MKSYGRVPTFLLATGYQQVRSVVAVLAGDQAGALRPDQGPPAAALCARNRDLLASTQRHRQLLLSIPAAPGGTTAAPGRTVADWSAASCCPYDPRWVPGTYPTSPGRRWSTMLPCFSAVIKLC
jgi:hypothetical protein